MAYIDDSTMIQRAHQAIQQGYDPATVYSQALSQGYINPDSPLGQLAKSYAASSQPTTPTPTPAANPADSTFAAPASASTLPVTGAPDTVAPDAKSIGGFGHNIISDTGQTVGGIAQAVFHPVNTLKSIVKMGGGEFENLMDKATGSKLPQDENQMMANNLNQYIKENFGSAKAIQNSLYYHPVQSLLLISSLADAGGGALGALGDASDASKAGEAANIAGLTGDAAKTATLADAGTNAFSTAGNILDKTADLTNPVNIAKGTGNAIKSGLNAIPGVNNAMDSISRFGANLLSNQAANTGANTILQGKVVPTVDTMANYGVRNMGQYSDAAQSVLNELHGNGWQTALKNSDPVNLGTIAGMGDAPEIPSVVAQAKALIDNSPHTDLTGLTTDPSSQASKIYNSIKTALSKGTEATSPEAATADPLDAWKMFKEFENQSIKYAGNPATQGTADIYHSIASELEDRIFGNLNPKVAQSLQEYVSNPATADKLRSLNPNPGNGDWENLIKNVQGLKDTAPGDLPAAFRSIQAPFVNANKLGNIVQKAADSNGIGLGSLGGNGGTSWVDFIKQFALQNPVVERGIGGALQGINRTKPVLDAFSQSSGPAATGAKVAATAANLNNKLPANPADIPMGAAAGMAGVAGAGNSSNQNNASGSAHVITPQQYQQALLEDQFYNQGKDQAAITNAYNATSQYQGLESLANQASDLLAKSKESMIGPGTGQLNSIAQMFGAGDPTTNHFNNLVNQINNMYLNLLGGSGGVDKVALAKRAGNALLNVNASVADNQQRLSAIMQYLNAMNPSGSTLPGTPAQLNLPATR